MLANGAPMPPGGCLTLNDATCLPALVRSNLNEDNVSWRGSIDYKVTSDSLLYITVAKGYKSGGYSIVPAIFASQIAPVTQESLLSYEAGFRARSEEHTSELQSLMRISYAVFCLQKKNVRPYMTTAPPTLDKHIKMQ